MTFQSRIEAAAAVETARPNAALPPRGRIVLVIVAATLVALVLRVWDIGTRSLWLDEAYSGWFSGLSWTRLWLETPRYETHPPLYYSLLKLWRPIAGGDAAGLRSLSALAGVATVPVIALAAQEMSRLAGVRRPLLLVGAAAALAAISPRLHVVGQDARPYALLTLAYAVGIYGWLRLVSAFRGGGDGRPADWAILGAGTVFVLWLHGIGILYAAALLAALVLTVLPGAGRPRWLRMAVTVGGVVLFYLPCLAILTGRVGDWSDGWLEWHPALFPSAMLQLYGLHRWDEMVTPVLALIAMPVLLFIALRSLAGHGRRAIAWPLGLLLLAPPLAAAAISQLGTPVFIPRTQVAVLVPAYLLVAYALASLPRRRGIAAAALVALPFLVNLGEAVVRPDLEPWREIAAVLKREMRPRDVIWVYPNDVKIPLERELGGSHEIVPIPAPYPALGVAGTHPSGSPAVVAIDAAQARRWVARHAPAPGATVWLLRGGPGFFDPDGSVLAELGRGRRHGQPRQWLDMELRPLHPR